MPTAVRLRLLPLPQRLVEQPLPPAPGLEARGGHARGHVRRPRRDRWEQTRLADIRAAEEAFEWTCAAPGADEPILDTHTGRTVRLIHPLRHHPYAPAGGNGGELLADVYNFDRRPGRTYLAA
jgi:hypothetical protein